MDSSPETPILIVDDDTETLDFLATHLRMRGFDVTTAGSAGEALVRVRERRFAVTVCDLRMPIVDGIGCLELLKTYCPDTEVILFSGQGTLQAAVDALKKGALDFLVKPIEMESFLLLLKKAIARSRFKRLLASHETSDAKGTAPAAILRESLEHLLRCFESDAGAYFVSGNGSSADSGGTSGYGENGPPKEVAELVAAAASSDANGFFRNVSLNQVRKDSPSGVWGSALTTKISSHMVVPVAFKNRFFGALALSRLQGPSAFSPQELETLRALADRLAAVLAVSSARAELERKSKELDTFRESRKAA